MASPPIVGPPNMEVLSRVIAIADFEAVREEELTFRTNDVFTFLTTDPESGWSQGLFNGKVGWFPQKYVRFLEGLELAEHLEKEVLRFSFYTSAHLFITTSGVITCHWPANEQITSC